MQGEWDRKLRGPHWKLLQLATLDTRRQGKHAYCDTCNAFASPQKSIFASSRLLCARRTHSLCHSIRITQVRSSQALQHLGKLSLLETAQKDQYSNPNLFQLTN